MPATLDPLKSAAPVIVYIDYKSPYAFVAINHTYALADELGVEFDWRPLTLDIPSYLGSARLNKQGKVVQSNRSASQWSGVKYAYADARRYARRQGLTLRGTEKIWDTRLVHIAMLWARQQGQQCLRDFSYRVYPAFWRRELDVEDLQVVQQLLRDSGAAVAGFEEYAQGAGAAQHDQLQHATFDSGIFGVPTYVVPTAQQWFFGREHLGTISWLVRRQQAQAAAKDFTEPAPDVAFPVTRFSAAEQQSAPATGQPASIQAATQTATQAPTLEIYLDLNDPQSYLALPGTQALLQRTGCQASWWTIPSTPQSPLPPQPASSASRGDRHRWFRAAYRQRELEYYASVLDLPLAHPDSAGATKLPALALLWAQHASTTAIDIPQLLLQLSRQQFGSAQPAVAEHHTIAAALTAQGADVAAFTHFCTEHGEALLTTHRQHISELGITRGPAYRYQNELFIGREHLPLLQELISG